MEKTPLNQMKSETRQNIVTLAQELIQVRGYNAFSYQDIADHLKIKKASVHHHFPLKEDLGAEVFEAALLRFEKWITLLPPNLSPDKLFDLFLERAGNSVKSGNRICLSGIFSAEKNTLPEKLIQKAIAFQESKRKWLQQTLEQGRKLGIFLQTGSVENQTLFVLATVQGGFQLARAQGKPELYETVMEQLRAVVIK